MVAILEQRHAQRCLVIDQVEVEVAGAGGSETAHLALDHHVEEAVLQDPPQLPGECTDGKWAPLAACLGGSRCATER